MPITKHKQQGAILIVSLLILLVLTMLGVSNLSSSIMEEKMASNAQTSTTTFQAAESAIRSTLTLYNDDPKMRGLSVEHAQARTVASCDPCNITSGTRMVYTGSTPLYNSSSTFVAHGVEIVGSASMGRIEESNTQGLSVFPMRP